MLLREGLEILIGPLHRHNDDVLEVREDGQDHAKQDIWKWIESQMPMREAIVGHIDDAQDHCSPEASPTAGS